MSESQDTSFARLVSLAVHDLRTPLATVHGFAQTIMRTQDVEQPVARYIEMIAAAARQMTEMLELVSVAARIESGRYEPTFVDADTLELARAAAETVDGAQAEGEGLAIETEKAATERALAAFALCARRHGAVPSVTLRVAGNVVEISPIGPAGEILLGEELRDLGAAVAARVVRALGGEVAVDGDTLRVTLG